MCAVCGKTHNIATSKTCSKECRGVLAGFSIHKTLTNNPTLTLDEYLENKKNETQRKNEWARKREKKDFVYAGRKKEYMKEYTKSHRKELNRKERERIAKDPVYAFKVKMRKKIGLWFYRRNAPKDKKSEEILGCTILELKDYISSKFKNGMTWDNYGEWQIDHIIPLATANTTEEVARLCHYTNLQPLWADENRSKSDKI